LSDTYFDEKYNIKVVGWDDGIYEPILDLPNIERIKEIYRHAHPRERSDLFRLLLLHKYGGSYVDTDDICFRSIPSFSYLSNSFCSSYDPHTCHYNNLSPDDCLAGSYREVKGYDHIPIFPRNDCWINFIPNHYMIHDILHDDRFSSRDKEVYIGDEFSWQRLTLEAIKKNINKIGFDFNFSLNLLYLYESHVGVASYWDRCWHGGPICDVWPIGKDDDRWTNYRTNQKQALEVFERMRELYKYSSFLWMHDKCGNKEWQLNSLDSNKDYLISTHIINSVRSSYSQM
jgi:hypothetical protein